MFGNSAPRQAVTPKEPISPAKQTKAPQDDFDGFLASPVGENMQDDDFGDFVSSSAQVKSPNVGDEFGGFVSSSVQVHHASVDDDFGGFVSSPTRTVQHTQQTTTVKKANNASIIGDDFGSFVSSPTQTVQTNNPSIDDDFGGFVSSSPSPHPTQKANNSHVNDFGGFVSSGPSLTQHTQQITTVKKANNASIIDDDFGGFVSSPPRTAQTNNSSIVDDDFGGFMSSPNHTQQTTTVKKANNTNIIDDEFGGFGPQQIKSNVEGNFGDFVQSAPTKPEASPTPANKPNITEQSSTSVPTTENKSDEPSQLLDAYEADSAIDTVETPADLEGQQQPNGQNNETKNGSGDLLSDMMQKFSTIDASKKTLKTLVATEVNVPQKENKQTTKAQVSAKSFDWSKSDAFRGMFLAPSVVEDDEFGDFVGGEDVQVEPVSPPYDSQQPGFGDFESSQTVSSPNQDSTNFVYQQNTQSTGFTNFASGPPIGQPNFGEFGNSGGVEQNNSDQEEFGNFVTQTESDMEFGDFVSPTPFPTSNSTEQTNPTTLPTTFQPVFTTQSQATPPPADTSDMDFGDFVSPTPKSLEEINPSVPPELSTSQPSQTGDLDFGDFVSPPGSLEKKQPIDLHKPDLDFGDFVSTPGSLEKKQTIDLHKPVAPHAFVSPSNTTQTEDFPSVGFGGFESPHTSNLGASNSTDELEFGNFVAPSSSAQENLTSLFNQPSVSSKTQLNNNKSPGAIPFSAFVSPPSSPTSDFAPFSSAQAGANGTVEQKNVGECRYDDQTLMTLQQELIKQERFYEAYQIKNHFNRTQLLDDKKIELMKKPLKESFKSTDFVSSLKDIEGGLREFKKTHGSANLQKLASQDLNRAVLKKKEMYIWHHHVLCIKEPSFRAQVKTWERAVKDFMQYLQVLHDTLQKMKQLTSKAKDKDSSSGEKLRRFLRKSDKFKTYLVSLAKMHTIVHNIHKSSLLLYTKEKSYTLMKLLRKAGSRWRGLKTLLSKYSISLKEIEEEEKLDRQHKNSLLPVSHIHFCDFCLFPVYDDEKSVSCEDASYHSTCSNFLESLRKTKAK